MKTAAIVAGCFAVFARSCTLAPPMPNDAEIVADLACETARMAVQLEKSPANTSDECENCHGTGKLGDGQIVTVCPVCKGTGKKAKP
jgi:DnaJ-class molecular chaperone